MNKLVRRVILILLLLGLMKLQLWIDSNKSYEYEKAATMLCDCTKSLMMLKSEIELENQNNKIDVHTMFENRIKLDIVNDKLKKCEKEMELEYGSDYAPDELNLRLNNKGCDRSILKQDVKN